MTRPTDTSFNNREWIDWSGGDRPVPKDAVVDVVTYTMGRMITSAGKICWSDVDKYCVLRNGGESV